MRKKNSFGLFSNRVIELANHAFSPMYRRVFKKYWDNSMFARMRRNYVHSDQRNGYYEIYIPTFESMESNMKYYRIAIQVVPELDSDVIRRETHKIRRKRITPVGTVDSELTCIVAQRRSDKAREKEEYFRGKHRYIGNMTGYFIHYLPESIIKRILMVVTGFLENRLKALLSSFHLTPQLQRQHNPDTLYYSTITSIIEAISLSLANAVRCISHSFHWLKGKIKHILREVGRQNQMRKAFNKITELKTLLKEINRVPSYMRDGVDPPYMRGLLQILTIQGG